MTANQNKLLIHKAVQVCRALGLNKNRYSHFKLALEIAKLNAEIN